MSATTAAATSATTAATTVSPLSWFSRFAASSSLAAPRPAMSSLWGVGADHIDLNGDGDGDDDGDDDGEDNSEFRHDPRPERPALPGSGYGVVADEQFVPRPSAAAFEEATGDTWIFPLNQTLRDYQFHIIHQALLKNTLVSLPTGLGKTFIAAVVMYNFYRWFPTGKLVFMAPTKPLVAQQVHACRRITGIPMETVAELTGQTQSDKRPAIWQTKRVFFLTPQVMQKDLERGVCPASSVVCVVVDEAHRAQGNYAYCEVIRLLLRHTTEFRVLALSATPGPDSASIQQVISNLLITHLEYRAENSLDVAPYVHGRQVEKIVVPMSQELHSVRERFRAIMMPFLQRLAQARAITVTDPEKISVFLLNRAREAFSMRMQLEYVAGDASQILGDFGMIMSLAHAYNLLHQHGIRAFYFFLKSFNEEDNTDRRLSRSKIDLLRRPEYTTLLTELAEKVERSEFSGHPKVDRLVDIVDAHFRTHETPLATRVMIFSQFRHSVDEIVKSLKRTSSIVKPMGFIGQGSTRSKGLTQQEQLRVVNDFKAGGYNTLVCTSIGEEGLDIGEVDLIVCFDAQSSPTRMLQRMGRTGRARKGRIVMLMTQGREEGSYRRSQGTVKSVQRVIAVGRFSYYEHNPRMVPSRFSPVVNKVLLTIPPTPTVETRTRTRLEPRGRKGPYLTKEELREWSDRFHISSTPTTKLLPLLPSEETMAWQTFPTAAHEVDHSAGCMAFMGMMRQFDRLRNERDDLYEMRMETLRMRGGDIQAQLAASAYAAGDVAAAPIAPYLTPVSAVEGGVRVLDSDDNSDFDLPPSLAKIGKKATTCSQKRGEESSSDNEVDDVFLRRSLNREWDTADDSMDELPDPSSLLGQRVAREMSDDVDDALFASFIDSGVGQEPVHQVHDTVSADKSTILAKLDQALAPQSWKMVYPQCLIDWLHESDGDNVGDDNTDIYEAENDMSTAMLREKIERAFERSVDPKTLAILPDTAVEAASVLPIDNLSMLDTLSSSSSAPVSPNKTRGVISEVDRVVAATETAGLDLSFLDHLDEDEVDDKRLQAEPKPETQGEDDDFQIDDAMLETIEQVEASVAAMTSQGQLEPQAREPLQPQQVPPPRLLSLSLSRQPLALPGALPPLVGAEAATITSSHAPTSTPAAHPDGAGFRRPLARLVDLSSSPDMPRPRHLKRPAPAPSGPTKASIALARKKKRKSAFLDEEADLDDEDERSDQDDNEDSDEGEDNDGFVVPDDDGDDASDGTQAIYRQSLLSPSKDEPPTPRTVMRMLRHRGRDPLGRQPPRPARRQVTGRVANNCDDGDDGIVWSDGGETADNDDDGGGDDDDDLMLNAAARGRDLSDDGPIRGRTGVSPVSSDLSSFVVDDDDEEALLQATSPSQPTPSPSPTLRRPHQRTSDRFRRLAKRGTGSDPPSDI